MCGTAFSKSIICDLAIERLHNHPGALLGWDDRLAASTAKKQAAQGESVEIFFDIDVFVDAAEWSAELRDITRRDSIGEISGVIKRLTA